MELIVFLSIEKQKRTTKEMYIIIIKVLDSDKKHNNIVDEQHLAQINLKNELVKLFSLLEAEDDSTLARARLEHAYGLWVPGVASYLASYPGSLIRAWVRSYISLPDEEPSDELPESDRS